MLKYLFLVVAALLTIFSSLPFAQADAQKDFKIFDLKKSLPLNDREKIYYDYYVNIGQDHGVQPGNIINVYRRVPVMDVYKNQNHPDMRVAVGKLKVIYSQKSISVARVWKMSTRDKTPVLEFEKMMVGDRVELTKIADEDLEPVKRPRKIASQRVVKPVETQELKLPTPVAVPQVIPAVEVDTKKD